MERITCYKLCYALGVDTNALKRDFPVIHRICNSTDYFGARTHLMEFRVCSAVLNAVVRQYRECATKNSVRKSVIERAVESAIGEARSSLSASVLLLLEQDANTIEAFIGWLNNLQYRRTSNIDLVVSELETTIPASVFAMMVVSPVFDMRNLAQYAFMADKRNPLYNLQFFNHEVLNVSVGGMLQDDYALHSRLVMFAGCAFPVTLDRSKLYDDYVKYLGDVVLTKEALEKYPRLYLCREHNTIELSRAEQYTVDVIARLLNTAEVQITTIGLQGLPEVINGAMVFFYDEHQVSRLAQSHPALDFAVTLPIESRYYRRFKKRVIPNIYMLDGKVVRHDA